MTTGPKCTWDADLGWMTPEHLSTCKDDCPGCRPCPKTHCAMRGRCPTHVDVAAGLITCPGCIGKVRADLAAVVELSTHLLDEAVVKGVNSEAANLAGPAADPEAVMWRRVAGSRRSGTLAHDDEQHPLSVLGTWDLMLREDYGPATNLTITIVRAHDYLRDHLGRLAHDDEQDFDQFASEIRQCRDHIETVLGDSRTPERGAPCPRCRTDEEEKPPRLVKHYATHDRSGASDQWRCPRVDEHRWSEADYRLRVGDDYLDHAKALTASNLVSRLGVPEGRLRAWAQPQRTSVGGELVLNDPRLKCVGRDGSGRKVYSVAVAESLRDAQ